ncbi:hypothetical protein CUT44_27990 [Streptomyces carminius]|uniref:Antitoxin n=1 Tax=Streptomyces carminius TaxID=2665496 RepID=A0A2M8LQB6_9ACTN|nr:type II toxin-antitoxin system Phd/YefM family antitoxin [Streptomyces carminius]PJE94142.1 hypothetical protein CUT44_27990 [Streptomyces carminius]
MTATEVSRNFASVLDQIEQGETVIITRGGRRLVIMKRGTAGRSGNSSPTTVPTRRSRTTSPPLVTCWWTG